MRSTQKHKARWPTHHTTRHHPIAGPLCAATTCAAGTAFPLRRLSASKSVRRRGTAPRLHTQSVGSSFASPTCCAWTGWSSTTPHTKTYVWCPTPIPTGTMTFIARAELFLQQLTQALHHPYSMLKGGYCSEEMIRKLWHEKGRLDPMFDSGNSHAYYTYTTCFLSADAASLPVVELLTRTLAHSHTHTRACVRA